MAQPVATQNFLIHDANGRPQVIKVVHTSTSANKSRNISQNQGTVVRTSAGIIKSTATPVRQLYNDDDSDSGSGYVVHRNSETSQTSSPYKTIRPPQRVFSSDNDNSQSPSEKGLIIGSKRVIVPAKRLSPDSFHDVMSATKRRRGEKGSKGLRHFSMKVCQKVKQKGKTTYNEVADELVSEFTGTVVYPGSEQSYDQKNIRRRVYDALNVLMAMNIISKEKKEIRWLGLPSGMPRTKSGPGRQADMQRSISQRIAHKKKTLQNLILQQVAFKNLMQRNKENEALKGPPAPGAVIQLPMLVVSTNQNTTVNCSVSNDKKEYFFNFDDVFEINDENHVLEGMGMMMGLKRGNATPEDLIRAKLIIPRALHPYLEEMVESNVSPSAGYDYPVTEEEEDNKTEYLDYEEDREDSASDVEGEAH